MTANIFNGLSKKRERMEKPKVRRRKETNLRPLVFVFPYNEKYFAGYFLEQLQAV